MKDKVSEEHHCPICDISIILEPVPYLDPVWSSTKMFDGLSIEFCNLCGFGYSTPELDDDSVNHFYAEIYRGIGSPFFTNFSAMSKPISHNYRSLSQLVLARHFVQFEMGDSFVDIGPGSGESFVSATSVLPDPKMLAVELSDGAPAAYKDIYGVDTFDNIENLALDVSNIKIILSSHSLEHFKLDDLQVFLINIKNALSPDGVFVAEVPHVDMRIHSQMRVGDSPHFLFFSKESLQKVLELSGFEVLFLESCGQKYNEWWIEQTENKQYSSLSSWFKDILRAGFAMFPMSIKRLIKRSYTRLNVETINFDTNDFSYGGDRTCLRVVARPQIRNKSSL